MIILNDPTEIPSIDDEGIRKLVNRRFNQLGIGACFIIAEPGDSVAALEKASGCPILRDLFDEASFGDDDFAPAFEVLEDHGSCYEMLFIFGDDGSGVEVFIPKAEGIDAELLALCQAFAIPATSSL